MPLLQQVLSNFAQSLYSSPALSAAVAIAGTGQPRFVRNLFTEKAVLVQAQQCPLPGCSLAGVPICPYVYVACDGSTAYATPQQRCAPTCPTLDTTAAPPKVDDLKLSGSLAAVRPIMLVALAVLAVMMLSAL